jgi:manganese/iron transport system substrate-binding protein
MKRKFAALVLLLLAGLVQSCRSLSSSGSDHRPEVVATTALLCDLVHQLAGASVHLICLMKPEQDPHSYVPTPADREAIARARLVFYAGYGFDTLAAKAAQHSGAGVAVSERAVSQPLRGSDEDRGETAPDPHVWNDARNGQAMVRVVSQQLQTLLPSSKAEIHQRDVALEQELGRLDNWIHRQIATIPVNHRQLVSTHDSLAYYGHAYGLKITGTLQGLSTQQEPTPTRLAALVTDIRRSGVPAVFVESTTNPRLISAIAREAKVQVSRQALWVEGPSRPDGPAPSYQRMLIENTCTIVNDLGGHCQRPTP